MHGISIGVDTFPTTVWDVLTAIGTVSAVAFSLIFALVETKRRRDAEKARDVAEARQRNAEKQALIEKVAVWLDVFLTSSSDGEHHDEVPDATERHLLTIHNHSDLPIFDVLTGFIDGDSVKLSSHYGDHYTHFDGPVTVRLMPGDDLTIEVPGVQPDGKPVGRARGLFAFRDVRGDWWARDWTGAIIELPTGSAARDSLQP